MSTEKEHRQHRWHMKHNMQTTGAVKTNHWTVSPLMAEVLVCLVHCCIQAPRTGSGTKQVLYKYAWTEGTSKVKAVLPNFQKDNERPQIVTSVHLHLTKGHRLRQLFYDQYLSMEAD